MKKAPHYGIIICTLICLFSIPVTAQEGRFNGNTKAEQENPEKRPLLPEKTADFSELRSQGTVIIDQVIDPLTLRLQDGRIVSLSSMIMQDQQQDNNQDAQAAAYESLKSMLEKKAATFYQVRNTAAGQRNRMGHYLGHIETRDDKIWVQGFMLLNGFAQIQPSSENTEMALQMIALENEAIKEKRGVWSKDSTHILTPETAEKGMNRWGIVEGRILKAAMNNNIIYLNFSDDWRKDFSIGIEPEVRRQLAKENLSALNMNGKKIRIRGWIESYNGPFIRLSHANWLEILPEAPQKDKLPADN